MDQYIDKTKEEGLTEEEKISRDEMIKKLEVANTKLMNFLTFGIYGDITGYIEKNQLEKRLLYIEKNLDNNQYDISNYYYLRKMVENYILAPVELNKNIFDNFWDIVSEENFDKIKIDEFLDFKINDLNFIYDLVKTIVFQDGLFIVNTNKTPLKVINILINNGYIKQYTGMGNFMITDCQISTYKITNDGLKFIAMFIDKNYLPYINYYEIGYNILHNTNRMIIHNTKGEYFIGGILKNIMNDKEKYFGLLYILLETVEEFKY